MAPGFFTSSTLAWISLVAAGLFEIIWAASMKQSHGFTKLAPTVIMIASVALLSFSIAHTAARYRLHDLDWHWRGWCIRHRHSSSWRTGERHAHHCRGADCVRADTDEAGHGRVKKTAQCSVFYSQSLVDGIYPS
jgi:Small Multidrug Resistance (SMR) protein